MGSSKKASRSNEATLLTLVVDRSGSMSSIKEDMEGGIKTLLSEQAKEEGTCLVTLAQFDNVYEVLADCVPVSELARYELVPRGSTALLDAIGRTIAMTHSRLAHMDPQERPATVVFVVITDGQENASVEWSRMQVMDSVKARSAEGWHFTFLGANQDAIQEGGGLGVAAASSLTWEQSQSGAQGAMTGLSASVRRVRTGKSRNLEYTEAERKAASGD
jgi:Mg-chelatase subunit ChlD